MANVIERIAWRIPYNPAWLDRHECESGVCLVRVPYSDYGIWAIPREVDSEVCYEPVYLILVDAEPEMLFASEPPKVADVGAELTLDKALPKSVRVRVLNENNRWQTLDVRPHLAVIQTEEDVQPGGICVAYSLPGAEPTVTCGSPDLYASIPQMMRRIYDRWGACRQPFFFIWF